MENSYIVASRESWHRSGFDDLTRLEFSCAELLEDEIVARVVIRKKPV
jgi:hypothetical protein